MERNIEKYYTKRASEYDQVYQKPERQKDLRKLESILSIEFKGLDVLEVTCGTGYWTQFIAKTARAILATDYSYEVIQIARKRDYGDCSTSFMQSDAYILAGISCDFSGGFCGFWWSHLLRNRREEFLRSFHSHLLSGAKVIIIDNRYVEGSSTAIAREDGDGNTYQLRKLIDGSEYEVLKNFPSEEELKASFNGFSVDLKVTLFEYYWMVSYRIRN